MAGNVPHRETLTLSRGADFMHEVGPPANAPDIPPGTTVRIEVTDSTATDAPIVATWDAAFIDSRIVRFRVESEECDEITARWYRMMVRYPEDPDDADFCWFCGPINRIQ